MPDRPHPRILKQPLVEEECFAPCRRSEKKQAAREARTPEPKTRPETPGDGPVEEKQVFRSTLSEAVLEPENNSKSCLWGTREHLWINPGKIQNFRILPKLRHKNRSFASFRIFPDIWRDPEAYLDHSSIFGVFTWAAGGPNSMESREICSKLGLSEAFLYMGSGRLVSPTPDF